eukprot:10402782-Alexandrium_andersonii.AAC.1
MQGPELPRELPGPLPGVAAGGCQGPGGQPARERWGCSRQEGVDSGPRGWRGECSRAPWCRGPKAGPDRRGSSRARPPRASGGPRGGVGAGERAQKLAIDLVIIIRAWAATLEEGHLDLALDSEGGELEEVPRGVAGEAGAGEGVEDLVLRVALERAAVDDLLHLAVRDETGLELPGQGRDLDVC